MDRLSFTVRPGVVRAAASFSGPVHPLHPSYLQILPVLQQALGADLLVRLWGDPVEQRANWEAHDPYYYADQFQDTPVYLSCGNGDPGPLDPPDAGFDQAEAINLKINQALAGRLRQARVPVTTNFYEPGAHHPAYGERELRRSLPLLLKVLRPGHRTTAVP